MSRIITFPMGITNTNPKVGHFVVPTYTSIYGEKANITSILFLNVLDTYCEREDSIGAFLENTTKLGLNFSKVILDIELESFTRNVVLKLLRHKKLFIQDCDVDICECGRVEVERDKLTHNGKCFNYEDGKIVCKICKTETKTIKVKKIYCKLPMAKKRPIVTPFKFQKNVEHLYDQFENTEFAISKYRNTGITIEWNHNTYNLDIDFIWGNIFNYLENKVGRDQNEMLLTTHVLKHFVLIDLIYNLVTEDPCQNKISIIPYIKYVKEVEAYQKDTYLTALLLSAINIGKAEIKIDNGKMKNIKKDSLQTLTEYLDEYKKINISSFTDFQDEKNRFQNYLQMRREYEKSN